MPACTLCGAELPDDRSRCPACGAGSRGEPATAKTQPLGSPHAALTPDGRAATLVLGSGVELADVPDAQPSDERRPVARVAAAPKPVRAKNRPDRVRKLVDPAPAPPPAEPPGVPKADSALHASDVRVLPRNLPRRTSLAVIGVASAVAGVALVVLIVVASRGPRLHGSVSFDLRGAPRLGVDCTACPDGTELTLGAERVTMQNGHAELALDPPVSIGERELTLGVGSPPAREPRRVELTVPISWVVSADMRGLSQPTPKLAVVVDARPEVGVIVDGHALSPNATGNRRYEIDVRDALTGPSPVPVALKRRVPYAMTGKNGAVTRGEIELEAEVVPLVIEAPGESIVIESASFTLAGGTAADASVTVEGRPITVDPSGRFAQLMSVSAVGDTTVTVRASAPGHAPRLVPIRVRRVASLAKAAAAFAQHATSSYSAIADSPRDKKGWAVALSGKIRDIAGDGYSTEMTMDVENGCPKAPCPVRLRFGSRVGFADNERISAYGYLSGSAKTLVDGHSVPQVRVEFARGEP